jgi:hypothetical protein
VYSPEITERRLFQARKRGLEFQRLPRERSIEIAGKLEKLRFDSGGNPLPDGQLARSLDAQESAFILSERILCKCDFVYYLTRYNSVEIDPGVDRGEGIGPVRTLESQDQFIRVVGRREEEVHAEYAKHKHTEGIKVYAHKCRQVLITSVVRAITIHRMNFWPGTRAFTGTLDPDGSGEAYKRDKIIIDRLPFWLKPELYPDVKDQEIGFKDPIASRLRYQPENQKTGIGTGTQMDVSHLTEVALWRYPFQIDFSFIPGLPKGRMTFHVQESTSFGKDYWATVTEGCRRRRAGYESWTYLFIPWYFNRMKYRAIVPGNWTPKKHTIEHAELVERTSPEFCNGNTFRLSIEQMYWWETERTRQARDGQLAAFYNNYPATPEQSFTSWREGALPAELLERMEFEISPGRPFDIEVAA